MFQKLLHLCGRSSDLSTICTILIEPFRGVSTFIFLLLLCHLDFLKLFHTINTCKKSSLNVVLDWCKHFIQLSVFKWWNEWTSFSPGLNCQKLYSVTFYLISHNFLYHIWTRRPDPDISTICAISRNALGPNLIQVFCQWDKIQSNGLPNDHLNAVKTHHRWTWN